MAVINFDRTKSTMHIYSLKAHKDLVNGNVVDVAELAVGVSGIAEGEVFASAKPTKTGKKVFVAGVPLMADEKLFENDFKVKAGEIVRGVELESGDIIGMTIDGLNLGGSTPKAGDLVVVEAGSEVLAVKETAGAEDVVYGKVIEIGTLAFEQAVYFLV